MKKMKKFFALLIAMAMVLGMSTSVFAASITITQDDTYQGTDGEAGREYSYYKVFSASYGDDYDGTAFEGGYEDDGTAVTEQGEGKVSYTATAEVGAKLQDAGNLWFDAVAIPGSEDGEYVVTWKEGVATDAETVQAAAAWLIDNEAYESGPTVLDFAGGEWTSGDVDPGYYIISSDTGNNLAAVTTDIEIKEKNAYPPINKEQADEDDETPTEDVKSVAIGDVLTYTATVTIPATAKVGDTMVVRDTPSKGLTYNDDVTFAGSATVDFTKPAITGDQAWAATITVTEASKGTDVVFTYTMTVNEEALVDSDKINTFELDYGDHYTSIPETVEYETYFSGIEKVDGEDTTIKLEGVEFTLKEGDVEFKVSKAADGYYYYDAAGSSTVVTDADGLIIIRGLDNDKEYTLTETANPNPGYNMLSGPATLTLVKDEGDAYATATFDQIENNKGTELPSTGGIGTTIFYIVGAMLVIGAGVVLVTRRRMDAQ